MKTVFISYGGPDEEFAIRLEKELSRRGAQTFLFTKHAKPGEKLHRVMRDAVNKYDKVILICSEASLNRVGVLNEIEETLQREAREGGKSFLIPIRLDDYVLADWAPEHPGLAIAINDRVVADFRNTQNDEEIFQNALTRLYESLLEAGDKPPLAENVRGRSIVEILDSAGHKARLVYERTLIPRVENLDRLLLTDVSSSGKIEFVSTNIGYFEEFIDEGGKKTVWTRLDNPLQVDKEVTHIVEMMATDCYMEAKESSTFFVTSYYQVIELDIYVPKERPAKEYKAWRRLDWQKTECSGMEVTGNGTHLHLSIKEPIINATYIVEWQW